MLKNVSYLAFLILFDQNINTNTSHVSLLTSNGKLLYQTLIECCKL